MADKYSTIQQHQPLRTPSSFDKQGKALIVQLDEIFDDIYRRFGRLKVSDLGAELKNLCLVKDENGKYVSIDVTLDNLSIEFGHELDGKIDKTEIYQDAESIITAAESYTDGVLTDYSTTEQTAQAISTYVTNALGDYSTTEQTASAISTYVTNALGDYSTTQQTATAIQLAISNCYGKISSVEINGEGVVISGSRVIKLVNSSNNDLIVMNQGGINMKTGSEIRIESGSSIQLKNSNSEVTMSLSPSGINLKSGSTVLMWSGSTFTIDSGSNFEVKSGGHIKFINSNNGNQIFMDGSGINIYSGTKINIRNSGATDNLIEMSDAGLVIKSGGAISIASGGAFSDAAGNLAVDTSGNATLKGGVEILSGRELRIKSAGALLIEGGGTLTLKESTHAWTRISMSEAGLSIHADAYLDIRSYGMLRIRNGTNDGNLITMSDAGIAIKSGGSISIESGGEFSDAAGNLAVDSSGNASLKGSVEILSGKDMKIKSNGAMVIESGGSFTIKESHSWSRISMDESGIIIYSDASVNIRSGGELNLLNSGNTDSLVSLAGNGIAIESGGYFNVKAGGSVQIRSGSNFWVYSGGSIAFLNGNDLNMLKMDDSGINIFSGATITIANAARTGNIIELGTDGLYIKSGGKIEVQSGATFNVYSSNIDIDNTGLTVKQGNLRGTHYDSDGTPLLSKKDIIISSSAPSNPKAGTLWVKPASGTVVVNYSCGVANNTVVNGYVGTLTSSNYEASSGSTNTYRLQLIIHANTSSGNGADFSIYVNDMQGNILLLFTVHANPGYYSGGIYYGDTVVDVQATSASWFGSASSFLIAAYATGGDHIDSYKIPPGNITLTCASNTGSSAGWANCEVQVYQ